MIKKIFAYGRSFEIVKEGMTCAVLIEYTAHSFSQFENCMTGRRIPKKIDS